MWAGMELIRYVAAWAVIGTLVPLILFLLDRLAGALINAFPAWFALPRVADLRYDVDGVTRLVWRRSHGVIGRVDQRRLRRRWSYCVGGDASNEASIDVNRRTSQCNRPGRVLLASAANRERSLTPLKR